MKKATEMLNKFTIINFFFMVQDSVANLLCNHEIFFSHLIIGLSSEILSSIT